MSALLEHQLADFAYKHVDNALKQEYGNMIINWQIHVEKLIGYAKRAFQNHELILKAIQEKMRQKQQADADFALLVFALISGPAISFVSGALQYNVSKRLFKGKPAPIPSAPPSIPPKPVAPNKPRGEKYIEGRDGRPRIAPGHREEDEVARGYKHFKEVEKWEQSIKTVPQPSRPGEDWTQTKAKVFGDFGGSWLTFAQAMKINPAIQATVPSSSALDLEINLASNATDLISLETNLRNAMREGKKMGETAIANYAGAIQKDHDYGRKWLQKLKDDPWSKNASEQMLRVYGEKMIRDTIDEQRRKWATEWYYFGHTAAEPVESYAVNAIEVEIWRWWILREGFKLYETSTGYSNESSEREFRAKGSAGIHIDEVYGRLVELGVLQGRSQAEMDKIFWKKHKANDRGGRKGVEDLGLVPTEAGYDVTGNVDTAAELDEILNWAANRKSPYLSGSPKQLPHTPRASVYQSLDETNIPTK
jgi:hypothetical protein